MDIDDSSSTESDDLDARLGHGDERSFSALVPYPACRADLVSEGCNPSTYEGEEAIGVLDGAFAQSGRRSCNGNVSARVTVSDRIPLCSLRAAIRSSGSNGRLLEQEDGPTMVPEATEQKHYDSPVVEVLGAILKYQSECETAPSMVSFSDLVEPSSCSTGDRTQSLATQEQPISPKETNTVVESTPEDLEARKIDLISATAYGGNYQESDSISPQGRLLKPYGTREMYVIKPTVFDKYYTDCRNSRDGREMGRRALLRYEV